MVGEHKDSFLARLEKSAIFTKLREKATEQNDLEVVTLIESAVPYACNCSVTNTGRSLRETFNINRISNPNQ